MSNPISDYMREIGSKGGSASKGSPAAKERAKKAAAARWKNNPKAKRP